MAVRSLRSTGSYQFWDDPLHGSRQQGLYLSGGYFMLPFGSHHKLQDPTIEEGIAQSTNAIQIIITKMGRDTHDPFVLPLVRHTGKPPWHPALRVTLRKTPPSRETRLKVRSDLITIVSVSNLRRVRPCGHTRNSTNKTPQHVA